MHLAAPAARVDTRAAVFFDAMNVDMPFALWLRAHLHLLAITRRRRRRAPRCSSHGPRIVQAPKLRRRTMNLVRSLTALTLVTLSGLAAAQPAHPPVATPHERAEVRHDNREITRDRHTLQHSRYEMHHAQREHDYKRVSQIRHDMHQQNVTLHRHRVEKRHDVRDLHHM
jgi:hypothetical protein